MGFYEVYTKYKDIDFKKVTENITDNDIEKILNKHKLDEYDFLTLLSNKASKYIEEMANRARGLALKHHGKAIVLYTPMYIANYCVNKCAYCGFNIDNEIKRKKLTMEEIEEEAKSISRTGLKHILLLTGESKKHTPVSYIVEAVKILKKYFHSVTIEIYPLTEGEYKEVIEAGVDGLTIYQEVYDEEVYDKVHLAGPKKKHRFRLDAPERACKGKIRRVNIGALLGLNDFRKEALMTGLHAKYLQDKYSDVDVSISLPRIRPHVGVFDDVYKVTDKDIVQIMLATRLFIHNIGINISTREKEEFRNNLIPLGVTKMSAGVTTAVGGHTSSDKDTSQFEISDKRTVEEVREAIYERGYHPVYKDWMRI